MWRAFIRLIQEVCNVPPPPVAPPGDHAQVFRAAPGWWRYRMTLWLIGHGALLAMFVTPLLVVELVAGPELPAAGRIALRVVEWVIGSIWLLSLPIGYALRRLDYEYRWYLVTDRSVRIREGIVIVHEMTLTFANVQNVTIEQGPLQRAFGIADLRVQTAGGGAGHEETGLRSMHTGILRGIDNAVELREAVLARLRAAADAGLGDPDDASKPPALVEAANGLLAEARALAHAAERLQGANFSTSK
jgi:uncharacterized membrane protein YdbT with pleckstrin-like domain